MGEIHADFLDGDEDNISTGRNSAHWESDAGQKLQDWGMEAVKYVFEQWLALQRQEKETKIKRTADFDKWLATRTPREQKVANKLIKTIVDDANIEPESAGPLLEIIKTNVEFQAFQEFVEEIESSGANVPTLLKLFEDWRIIEAREHLRLSDGRLEVMEKLAKYIDEGALEVKQIQPLFEENGWLVNPTWGHISGQNTYTKLLRENCVEPKSIPEEDKRMDILGYEVGGYPLGRGVKASQENLDSRQPGTNRRVCGLGKSQPCCYRPRLTEVRLRTLDRGKNEQTSGHSTQGCPFSRL